MGAYSSRVETWALYSAGSLVMFTRIACRWRMVGWSGFKPDDYIIFLSWVTYTVMTYAADVVGGVGDLHALPLDVRKNLTPEESKPLVYATKWFCVGVATYNLFIWSLKFNMLFLYQRVVRGLWVQKFILPTMVLTGATFVAVFIALFAACRPYNRMWAVYPDEGPLCQPQSTLNIAAPLALNLFTDLIIAAIPAPIIFRVKTSLWNKIGLLFLFSAVAFIAVAAILRVTMVLISGPVAAIWSCREDFVAILVGQFFMLRPMFSKAFWSRRRSTGVGLASSDSKDASKPTGSFDTKSKWSFKKRDPFSVTAALATVNNEHEHSSDIALAEPKSGWATERAKSPVLHEDPSEVYGSYGDPAYQPDDMVIYVTKQVQVDEAASGQPGHEESRHPTHFLHPTNRARVWNQSPV
ncbi:hypothetical protein F4778DRAFT_546881 [Xylariomycetidae sp. FL2044]|nr:hypothetical protein F4778DRAFT_546881 [Xylariomycetidae sp. FL2044]